ncbi:hypothetical protein HRI_002035400 [Hibiscus trionum]|uniref:Endonuclease/exonuclease/phosphatase domain-containing protein n=1 Tax=Hibiscus trionum TaxID=183268 RepID=A0A9W7M112_HIBTR|nr:hypothetical protein HRI_002035400 [Hibiscus trionum]
MEFRIVSWNIRGLGRKEKVQAIRNMVREKKPQVVFIQETKVGEISRQLLRRMGCDKGFDFSNAPREGSSGGVLSLWDVSCFEMLESRVFKRFTVLLGKFRGSSLECSLMNVYGPNTDADRKDFFREILEVMKNHKVAWCLGGDFNAITGFADKSRWSWNFSAMEEFRSFIQAANLINFLLIGGAYTWSNNRDPPTFVRLDRFLVDDEFLEGFPSLNQFLLSKVISDHNAISLETKKQCKGFRPFRLYNYITAEEGFDEMLEKKIHNFQRCNVSMGAYSLLKLVKGAVKKWSSNKTSGSALNAVELEKQIAAIESNLQSGTATMLDKSELVNLKDKL